MKRIIITLLVVFLSILVIGCGDPAAAYWEKAKPEVERFSNLRNKFVELTTAQSEGINVTYKSDFEHIVSETEAGLSNLRLLDPPPKYSQLNTELVGAFEDMNISAEAMVSAMDDYASGFSSSLDYMEKGLTHVKKWVEHWENVGKLKPTEP